jgi:hypothetical protein
MKVYFQPSNVALYYHHQYMLHTVDVYGLVSVHIKPQAI